MRSALVVLAVVATACGSDPAPRPATSSSPPTQSSPSTAPATATPSISVEAADAHFSTPTKNIGCYVGREGMSCEISRYAWELPPRPASCDADWGAGLTIEDDGTVEVGQCRSDTNMGAERVLAYGTGVEVGPFRCTSETAGLTCVHLPTG